MTSFSLVVNWSDWIIPVFILFPSYDGIFSLYGRVGFDLGGFRFGGDAKPDCFVLVLWIVAEVEELLRIVLEPFADFAVEFGEH